MNGFADLTKMETNRNCLRRIARHDEPQFSKDSIVNVMEKFVKTVNVMDDTILVPCRLMDRQVGDSTDTVTPLAKDQTTNLSENIIQQTASGKNTDSATSISAANDSKNVHEFLNSSELFNLYNILNALKKDLLWSGKDGNQTYDSDTMYCETVNDCSDCNQSDADKTDHMAISNIISTTTIGANNDSKPTHNRRPSNTSVVSVASVSQFSDSESVISNENDSGVESEGVKTNGLDEIACNANHCLLMSKKTTSSSNIDKATELAKRCRRHLNGLYQCLEQMTEAANYLTARYQNDIGGGSV